MHQSSINWSPSQLPIAQHSVTSSSGSTVLCGNLSVVGISVTVVVVDGGVDGGVVGGAAVGVSVVPPVVPSVVGGSVPEDGIINCLTFS